MPRGRHRHSPPLHRLLPPSAIAGVSLVCALGPWVFTEQTLLRGLAAAAAVTAAAGAVVMRRWDIQAGKQVADLIRARASDEWRHEERVAELETDLEESRELRGKLEQRLRAKRTELAGLRNEHAALLRRYANAEAERASALEGRRRLEIEAAAPTRALPPGAVAEDAAEIGTDSTAESADEVPDDVLDDGSGDSDSVGESHGSGESEGSSDSDSTDGDADSTADGTAAEAKPEDPKLFSPEGSRLFLRAQAALVRFDADRKAEPEQDPADATQASVKEPVPADAERGAGAEAAQEDEARGKTEAADAHEPAAATTPRAPLQQPSGHYTVPTAVAVVPATTPVRRPRVEGGFDFFGTKGEASAVLESVQNEDLADVVGQEALDLHKADAEFKPVTAESRGVGQVIDLTAHDETEQIDMQGLRSAAS